MRRSPPSQPRRPVRNLRALLSWLSIAGALPAIAFSAALLYALWSSQQRQMHANLQLSVRSLALALEREVNGQLRRAELLAADVDASPAAIERLRVRATELIQGIPDWKDVRLVAPDGHVAISVVDGVRGGRGHEDNAELRRVLEDGIPIVSDLHDHAGAGASWMVAVPVRHEERVTHALIVEIDPAWLSRILLELRRPEEGIASVVDRRQRVVARNRGSDELLGRSATGIIRAEIVRAPQGVVRSTTLDGSNVFTAWQQTDFGWTVLIGSPADAFDAPLFRSLASLGLVGLALLLTGIAVSRRIARGLAAEIDDTAEDAALLAEGKPVPARQSGIEAIDALRTALGQASARIGALLAAERIARANAEQANRNKDELLAMIGHELRNPLGTVVNVTSLLRRAELTPQARSDALDMLERQSGHLKRLVDDLLDAGRVLSGKVALTPQPLDLAALVLQVIDALRATGRTGGHRIVVDCRSTPLIGDPLRLEQIVTNLLTNALRYTPEGGSIEVTLAPEGRQAVLRVADDGIGIDAELMPYIFDLFVQGDQDAHRSQGGLGVGLTLARRLVEMHGGTIDARSPGRDRGSTFEVRLPLAATPADDGASRAGHAGTATTAA